LASISGVALEFQQTQTFQDGKKCQGTTLVVPQDPQKKPTGLYRLRKNLIGDAVLKGHDFSRAEQTQTFQDGKKGQGTTLVVPQSRQKNARALHAAEKLNGDAVLKGHDFQSCR
jgi:hypothetical protein